ncbi:MAG: hypothetical protein ACK5PG_05990 [Lysobacterales bacterium]|jgi:hypothetical protein
MNGAQIDLLAHRLWAANAPAGTYSTTESTCLHIGHLETKGDQLALAVLRGVPAKDLQRLALEWIALRGVQVPA